jgi:hypothetical protein
MCPAPEMIANKIIVALPTKLANQNLREGRSPTRIVAAMAVASNIPLTTAA